MRTPLNWFHYRSVYDIIFDRLKDGDIFVEIGALYGDSTVYMAKKIKESGKKVKIYTIDKWKLDENSEEYMKQSVDDDFYNDFLNNVIDNGVKDIVIPLRGDSSKQAIHFKDKSINAIMFDGDHSYEGLKKDLKAFLPKLSGGAFIAGDDYNHPAFPGISQIVNETFGEDNLILYPSTDVNTKHQIWTVELA